VISNRAPIIMAMVLVGAVSGSLAEPTVSATVDAIEIGENESVTLSIEVKGSNLPSIQEPDISAVADFTVASGPNLSTSTSMVFTGGRATVTAVKVYSYVLLPRRRGDLSIPAVQIKVGSQTFRTRKLSIKVGKAGSRTRRAPRSGGRRPFGSLMGASQPSPVTGDIFVVGIVDKKDVYVGEQVQVVYKLYSQAELAALPQPRELPAFKGFWVEELPLEPRSTIKRTTIRGKEYLEITLMKKAIFPTRSGELEIEETLFEVHVRRRSNDPSDAFFNRSKPVFKRAEAISLHVKPLPQKGKPDSFRGAVGRYTMEVTADRKQVSVNDALGLKVRVEGDGNLQAIGAPIFPNLPDYRLFDPKVQDESSVVDNRLSGSRTWDYVLVPLTPGQQIIPAVKLGYFDPEAESYKELSGSPITVEVTRGTGPTVIAKGGGVRRDVIALRKDIRYIKPASSLGASAGDPIRSSWFYLLLLVPVAGNGALYARARHREHLTSNRSLFRKKLASRAARRRLRVARELAGAGNAESFYAELDSAVTGYLADKFNVAAAGLTRERIGEMLNEMKARPELARDLFSLLETCDFGRFAPGGGEKARLMQLLDSAEQLFARLERIRG
jgi:hypothetical protein